jgi:2-succinyl-6-hydroxy-2,4-cyclohexadiene-1-carboxylate synthase
VIVRLRDGRDGRVVFVHGMLGAPSSWGEIAAKLAGDPSVEAVWLPGHGLNPWGTDLPRFDDAIDALQARILASPAVVVGYSLGGRVALALAARGHPNLRHVVAIGANPGLDDASERAARVAWERSMIARVREGGVEALVDAWERLPLFATQARIEVARLDAQRRTRLGHTVSGLGWAFEVLGTGAMPSLTARLVARRAPLTLVVGEHDVAYVAASRALAERLPGVGVEVVGGVGHNVALEAPARLAAIVEDLLRARRESAQLA